MTANLAGTLLKNKIMISIIIILVLPTYILWALIFWAIIGTVAEVDFIKCLFLWLPAILFGKPKWIEK